MNISNVDKIAGVFPESYNGIFNNFAQDAGCYSLEQLHNFSFQIIFANHLINTKGLRLFSWQKKYILKELSILHDYILGKKYKKLIELFNQKNKRTYIGFGIMNNNKPHWYYISGFYNKIHKILRL